MAKYGRLKYGTDRYGSSAPTQPPVFTAPTGVAPDVPVPAEGSSGSDATLAGIPSVAYALDVSVDPFVAHVLDYGSIQLTWSPPGQSITDLVLIRSTVGFAVDESDGLVLYAGSPTAFNQYDDLTVTPGQEYYYSLFVRQGNVTTLYPSTELAPSTTLYPTASGDHPTYFPVATTRAVAVADKGSTRALLSHLPRVYTSHDLDSTGEVDTSGALAKFMSVFGFGLDKAKTDLANLVPFHDAMRVQGPAVPALASLVGQQYEGGLGLRQTRILARDACSVYTRKGSTSGIAAFVKALTGQAAVVSPGANLLPDTDDCSFEIGVGRWSSTVNCSVARTDASANIQVPPAPVAPGIALPGGFTPSVAGALVVTGAGAGSMSITYAGTSDAMWGALVQPGDVYAVSAYAATAVTGRSVTFAITWRDASGGVVSTSTQSSGTTDAATYSRLSYIAAAPAGAVFGNPRISWNGSAADEVHYVDCVQLEKLSLEVPNSGFESGALSPWTLHDPSVTTTNQLSNPSFEVDTAGWSGTATGYTASTLTQLIGPSFGAHDGSAVLQVEWPTAAAGASCAQYTASTLVVGQRYRFAVWVYVPSGSPTVRLAEVYSGGTSTVYETSDTGGVSDAWVHLSLTTIATASTMSFGVITEDPTIAAVMVLGGGTTVAGGSGLGAMKFGSTIPGSGDLEEVTVGGTVVIGTPVFAYLDDASLVNLQYSGANVVSLDNSVHHSGSWSLKTVGFLPGLDSYVWQTVQVRPGQAYTVTAYADVTAFSSGAISDRGLTVDDGTNAPQTATLTGTTGGFQALSVTCTPVSSWLQIRLYIPQGVTFWDDVTVELESPREYADARRADLFVFPSRVNLVTNPSFETNVTGWNVTGSTTLTRSTAHSVSGSASGLITHPTADKSGISTVVTDLTPGVVYTVSASVRSTDSPPITIEHDGQPYSATIAVPSSVRDDRTIPGGNAYGLTISESVDVTDAAFAAQLGTWVRISTRFLATDHVHTIGCYSYGTTIGQTVYLDDIMVEASPLLDDYFDGNSGVDYDWEDAANLSRSTFIRNKFVKSRRLADRVPEVIPTGVPYAVRLAWPGA